MCSSLLHLPRLDSTAYWSGPTSSIYCTAEIIDQASTKGEHQISFSSTADSPGCFSHLSCFTWSSVLLPKAHLDSFDLCVARQPPTCSWLIRLLLSAGGTAACWGRNVAWHLWKRSWGNKGWVPNADVSAARAFDHTGKSSFCSGSDNSLLKQSLPLLSNSSGTMRWC